jgi:hypothetical protein
MTLVAPAMAWTRSLTLLRALVATDSAARAVWVTRAALFGCFRDFEVLADLRFAMVLDSCRTPHANGTSS